MKNRCLYPSTKDYPDYGGRGIAICARWLEPRAQGFKNFLEDMGPRSIGKTLDRRNVNGHYCPENCRWADDLIQKRNKRCLLFPGGEGEPPVIPMDDLVEESMVCG